MFVFTPLVKQNTFFLFDLCDFPSSQEIYIEVLRGDRSSYLQLLSNGSLKLFLNIQGGRTITKC